MARVLPTFCSSMDSCAHTARLESGPQSRLAALLYGTGHHSCDSMSTDDTPMGMF